jgi:putative sterol carrier protein
VTKDEMATKMGEAGAFVPGKRVKLDFGADGLILLDGVDQKVSQEDGPVDATISSSWDDFKALAKGELNPMAAFMAGRVKVAGDMSVAMSLQNVLGKLA